MQARAVQSGVVAEIGTALPTIIMLGVAANGLAVRVAEGMGGGISLDLGIGAFQLLTLFVAVHLSLGSGEPGRPRFGLLVTLATLQMVLVPSSAVSWFALALYAGVHAASATGERRQGALLFLGLAAAALWSSVFLKAFAGPVTASEAFLVGKMLEVLRSDIVQTGNVVGNPEVHSLIVMTRCTTLDVLPAALVALVSVALFLGNLDRDRVWRAGVGLAGLLFAANLVRLCVMAWSAEAYTVAHGLVGANLSDGFQVVAVLVLGSWASRA